MKNSQSEGQSFASYLIHVSNEESNELKFMIVTNQENEIAKIELGVNEQVIEQELKVNYKSVYWIYFKNAGNLTYKFKRFDKDGNLIRD
ncbi:hypothetical protein [Niallia sp. 03133]|uniref:hypothetical protein n=1 Tax=Niallia sp. 03133 TaxID=3458060 RepID=UPI0040442CD9